MSAAHAERALRTSQSSPLSKPRAVYSIDQILGTHNHRRNNLSGEYFLIETWPNNFLSSYNERLSHELENFLSNNFTFNYSTIAGISIISNEAKKHILILSIS